MNKKGKVIWFTGLPCSGKTTIAQALIPKIAELGYSADLLDGDVLRNSNFSKGAGFSKEEREKHLLRVGFMASMLSQYSYAICSFVSPFEDVRNEMPIDELVYIKCSAEECARRDVKGMWAKAKNGEIKGFTGYDAPYEEPKNPALVLDTEKLTIDQCVDQIINLLGI